MSEALDKHFDKYFVPEPENPKEMRAIDQRLAGLEDDDRQSRLASKKADVPTDKKTCKRAEDTAADQAKHGDSCSAKRVDAGPTSSTSFGMTAKTPVLPRRDTVLVNKGVEALMPHLPPMEVRCYHPPPVANCLPAQPLQRWGPSFPDCFFLGASVKRSRNEPAGQPAPPPYWTRVIQTKPRHTLVFGSGGFTDLLRACPFLGRWRALLCGEVFVWTLR